MRWPNWLSFFQPIVPRAVTAAGGDSAEDSRPKSHRRLDLELDPFKRLFAFLGVAGILLALVYGLSTGTSCLEMPCSNSSAAGVLAQAGENGGSGIMGQGGLAANLPPRPAAASTSTSASRVVQVSTPTQALTTWRHVTGALLAVAICGAAAAVGAFSGFLFGLPRTLTSGEVRTASALAATTGQPGGSSGQAAPLQLAGGANDRSSIDLAPNSNLEQISDWLTKIIVGVGLTKFDSLTRYIENFGDKVDPAFVQGGKIFSIGFGLYFLIIGFLYSYVMTRTKLALIFVMGQKSVDDGGKDTDFVKKSANAPLDAATIPLAVGTTVPARPFAAVSKDVIQADNVNLSQPLRAIQSPDAMAARAAAEARAGNVQNAVTLFDSVVKESPTATYLINYAGVLGLAGLKSTGEKIMGMLEFLAPKDEQEGRRNMLVGLLRSGLENSNFEQSIAAGEQLLVLPGQGDEAWNHIWLARAYGQKHANLKASQGQDDAILAAKQNVLDHVRRAIEISPEQRSYIWTLYAPALKTASDADLQSLWRDADLEGLLGQAPENSGV